MPLFFSWGAFDRKIFFIGFEAIFSSREVKNYEPKAVGCVLSLSFQKQLRGATDYFNFHGGRGLSES